MDKPNQNQIDFWNGPAGQQWVDDQAQVDALLAPLSEPALQSAAPQPAERVIDIGCGCGTTSMRLAVHAAAVHGVDISEPMVGWALERSKSIDNVTFEVADASVWRGEQPSDLAFSRFGVMFFDDPVAAFSNIHANLKPGGRLCFVCWRAPQDNPWMSVAGAAAAPFVPEAPPQEGPNPFAFADPAYVTSILSDAGFTECEMTLNEATLTLGADVESTIQFLTRLGPLARVLTELEGEQLDKALNAVREALAPAATSEGVQLGASTWIVTAQAT